MPSFILKGHSSEASSQDPPVNSHSASEPLPSFLRPALTLSTGIPLASPPKLQTSHCKTPLGTLGSLPPDTHSLPPLSLPPPFFGEKKLSLQGKSSHLQLSSALLPTKSLVLSTVGSLFLHFLARHNRAILTAVCYPSASLISPRKLRYRSCSPPVRGTFSLSSSLSFQKLCWESILSRTGNSFPLQPSRFFWVRLPPSPDSHLLRWYC